MENIECVECEERVLGLSFGDPKPVGREDCHNCGGTEFSRLSGDGLDGSDTDG